MSDKRSKSFVSVVFPAPLVPTRPTRWPAGICSSKSSNTCVHASPSVYQKSMPSKSMAPSRTSSSGAPGLSSTRRDGHAARVAERAVEALQPVVDEVELVRHRVGVGEHHHERAGRDTVPRVAARDEHRHHAHNGDGDARRHDAARQRRPHALRVARHHLAVRLVEQPPLVVLAPVGLHRQDVRHRVGQLARQLVLRAGRLLVEVQDALVHVVRHARVHRQQHHEDGHVHRHARREDGTGEHHRADDRQKRERDGFQQQLVGAHELRRLADQRAAEAV